MACIPNYRNLLSPNLLFEDVERRERGTDEEPAHDVCGKEEVLGAEEDGRGRVGLPGALREDERSQEE